MLLKRALQFSHILTFSVLFFHCAGQIPPGGGPVDSVPPTVIHTIPDSNAVRVETDRIELEFSEYVDRLSVEESIFISPYVGDLEFDWSATEVTIIFSQPLKKNVTYVVNVGTDVKDHRARNRMAAGYTLAFSTGDSIDEGFIKGRVFDPKPEGVMIFAYALKGISVDTLDPAKVRPDYIMQTGTHGVFTLSNVAFDTYRLFAVRDEYRNLVYDRQIDEFGVTTGDVTLSPLSSVLENVWLRLSREDTTKPFITSVHTVNRFQLEARFSEPLDSMSVERGKFRLVDTLSLHEIPISIASRNRKNTASVDLITTGVDSGVTYRVHAKGLFDRSGNPLDSTNASAAFEGISRPDTLRPTLQVAGMRDSSSGISLDLVIELNFSEPVIQDPIAKAVSLMDSTKRGVPAMLHWLSASDAQILPQEPFNARAWYQLRLVLDSVQDLQGNRWRDSVFIFHFQTLDLRTTGVVEGVVEDPRQGVGRVFLTAASVDLNPPKEKTVTLEKPGKFLLDKLPEGKYTISAFRDSDGSGKFSYGQPFPFITSERFAVYADTLKVRARWSVEGVVVRFR